MSGPRTAILGAGHWHAKFIYPVLREDSKVVAVSEPDPVGRSAASSALGHCRSYSSTTELLDREQVDLAFVYGRHVDMVAVALELIERGIPFAIEKPAGVSASDVARIRDAAAAADLFVAVPFSHRLTPWVRAIRAAGDDLSHATFRLMSGPPSRYYEQNVGWVLDPKLSGGGCTINLSVLFVDLFSYLTGFPATLEQATLSWMTHDLAIEDYSNLTLLSSTGQSVATVETSYTYPNNGSQLSCSVRLASGTFFAVADDRFTIVDQSGSRLIDGQTHHRFYYADFARHTLARFDQGEPPLATLTELYAAMLIVDQAYGSPHTHRLGRTGSR